MIPQSIKFLIIASWMVTYLAGLPEWRHRARDEAHALLSMYATTSSTDTRDLAGQLATMPLEVWEKCTPVIDAVIRETLRVAQPHTAMRQNVGPEMYIAGARVPSGAYVVYPFSDVHLNPQLYPDPWRFDPGRSDCEAQLGYVGWGGGER